MLLRAVKSINNTLCCFPTGSVLCSNEINGPEYEDRLKYNLIIISTTWTVEIGFSNDMIKSVDQIIFSHLIQIILPSSSPH